MLEGHLVKTIRHSDQILYVWSVCVCVFLSLYGIFITFLRIHLFTLIFLPKKSSRVEQSRVAISRSCIKSWATVTACLEFHMWSLLGFAQSSPVSSHCPTTCWTDALLAHACPYVWKCMWMSEPFNPSTSRVNGNTTGTNSYPRVCMSACGYQA